MPQSVFIDFSRTFPNGVVFFGVKPKMVNIDKNDMKSAKVQATNSEGMPRWTVDVIAQVETFGEVKPEPFAVTIDSPTQPCTELGMGQIVEVVGLEMGTMARKNGGFSHFFRADRVQAAGMPAQSTPKQRQEA